MFHNIKLEQSQTKVCYDNSVFTSLEDEMINPLKCDLCEAVFRTTKGRNIHREKSHGDNTARKYPCCKCSLSFSREINLRRHRIRFHLEDLSQDSFATRNKSNLTKRNLKDYPAEKLKQQIIQKLECMKEKCPLCGKFEVKSTLKLHLMDVHGVCVKSKIKPKMREKSDNKINVFCNPDSSTLKYSPKKELKPEKSVFNKENDSIVPNNENKVTELEADDRVQCIISDSNVRLVEINHEVDDQLSINDETTQNQKTPTPLNSNNGNDFSVAKAATENQQEHSTVEKCSADENNTENSVLEEWTDQNKYCILFFKSRLQKLDNYPKLEIHDFVAVIMRSEQEILLKKYGIEFVCLDETRWQSDLYLITLIVITNSRECLPCCCLISNRNDEYVFKLFFSSVKEKTGRILTEVLMTDINDSCYSAWVQTMFEPIYRFYSSWNVTEEWKKNLSKIDSKLKKIKVYEILRALLTEKDESRFQLLLDSFLYTDDPETEEFREYFSEHFERNVLCWAHCYWLPDIVNAKSRLENVHCMLVRAFCKAEKKRKLDLSILNAISKITRKMLSRAQSKNSFDFITK